MRIKKEFISEEKKDFNFRLGTTVASGFAGFLAGIFIASLIWAVAVIALK